MICGNNNGHCDYWKGDATICKSIPHRDMHSFMQKPVHPSFERVKTIVGG